MTASRSNVLKALLVDDNRSVYEAFKKLFGSGSDVYLDIDFRLTHSDNLPYCGADLPKDYEFDDYDLALVDLELTRPWVQTFDHNRDSLKGGTEILPYLRAQAPWLPVICESKLLAKDAPHIFTAAGSYGFDGLFPQSLLERTSAFSMPLWTEIYDRAVLHRRVAAIGAGYDGSSRLEKARISPAMLHALGPHADAFEPLLKVAFHFAETIVVSPLPSGFSGASVFRVATRGGEQLHERPGYWLAKVSTSPSKLSLELQRHQMMTRSGADFAVAVPVLWRGVLVEKRLAMIAYRFAEGTHAASELRDPIHTIVLTVAQLLRRFYSDKVETDGSTKDLVLRDFGPWLPGLRASVDTLPASFRPFANAVLDETDGTLTQDITFRTQWIHGDLHLGNVMAGQNPVLIDFAASRIGPVAADAARLAADLLARFPDLRERALPKWKDSSALMNSMQELFDVFGFETDDEPLFSEFLALDLWDLTRYDSTDTPLREWIMQALATWGETRRA